MAIIEKVTGFPNNNRGRLYCADYKLDPAVIVFDSDFSTGKGVESNKLAAGTRLCSFNVFERGELSGHYILRLYWDTTNLAQNDLDVVVYEDGVALTAVDMYGDYDLIHGGSNVLCIFNPESEYRIELVSGADSPSSRVSLDYIQLDPVPSHAILGSVGTSYGVDGVSMDLLEKQTIDVTGDGTRYKDTTVVFRRTYEEPPSIQVTCGASFLNAGYGDVTTSQCNVRLNHINGSNWSSSTTFNIWLWGNVTGNARLGRDDL